MLDGNEAPWTALFQADMPLMVALLTVILVNWGWCAAEIHPVGIIPHGDILSSLMNCVEKLLGMAEESFLSTPISARKVCWVCSALIRCQFLALLHLVRPQ